VPVVRRHVHSERCWHRDYLLAHLARNRKSRTGLAPRCLEAVTRRSAILSAFRIASRVAWWPFGVRARATAFHAFEAEHDAVKAGREFSRAGAQLASVL
jgi:hypothetical protein